ncbi:MAG: peptidoglycan DD-metalloendopeptidase family protein [Actinobacteria bacterium]|nr:peptidoglycan DD-metalloendopeptidase family protein [Actinomycetota bacterium]
MYLRLLALVLLSGAVVGAGSSATPPTPPAVVSAGAYGISVAAPGQAGAGAASASIPGQTTTGAADGFAYPADGLAARTGAQSSSVSAGDTDEAHAVTDVLAISLLNGEVAADSVAGRAKASASSADTNGSQVTNLVLLGQPVAATSNGRFPLADWGYVVTLEQAVETSVSDAARSARASVTALRVVLTAEHGGLPAGAEILVGHAEASVSAPTPAATPVPARAPGPAASPRGAATKTPVKPARPAGVPPKRTKPLPKPPEPEFVRPGLVFRPPLTDVSAPLSPGGYVFPVYGPSSFTDTFEAPRAGIGWHHGEDIFAPLGAPLLAVADGTVFSVGWNNRGGYRFWLRDRQGNQFYYAHLSAFSPLAVNGNEVKAGAVIGFVGNTGDAQTTPYHVHFEIHPVGLLPMGYDGVVNAFPYLSAWRRVQDIAIAAGSGWAPPAPAAATAPKPAALLLGSTDISSASGLEPGSLERALAAPASAQG